MYVVGFNGPPYSGKDTAAAMLAELIQSRHPETPVYQDSLSLPLREIAYKMVGHDYDPATYDDFKRARFPQFSNHIADPNKLGATTGPTGRQLMIDVSESFLKPMYGQAIMAEMLARKYQPLNQSVLLIRDCGFQCEVDPLCDYFRVQNVRIVHVNRTDHTFVSDSREWVYSQDGTAYQLPNHGTLEHLKWSVDKLYYHLVEALSWQF